MKFYLRDDIYPELDILMIFVFSGEAGTTNPAAYSEAAIHINMNKK